MTIEEKAAAFDLIVDVFVCRYHDGRYAWFCLNPAGGEKVATPEEAVTDFLGWLVRARRWKPKSHVTVPTTKTELPVIE